ncbi:MAG: carboxypeptidase regulatory-like domain-containing protein, partial [Acidobacteriaceae bacterium]|nr:carboxypeptidase regulatory-like domain-containing protein [Acidobacteriaceae bacterium]
MRFLRLKIAALLAGLMLLSVSAFAQLTSGNITGTVYDQSGATVPNAAIIVHNTATGVENTTTSTSAGDYRFENLPVGTYTITVNAAGFAKSEVQNVSVELNQTVTTNVTLAVGKSTTSVEVSTAAVAIDTTTAQVQTTFETKQITDLPVTATGSGVINLSLLNAGVSTSGAVGAGTGPSVG